MRCLPRSLEGLKPVLILPVLGTLLVGLLMMYVIGTPVAGLLAWLTDWLRGMQGSSAILLGLLLGGMMAVDMGGPVNKASTPLHRIDFQPGLHADGGDDDRRHDAAAGYRTGDMAVQ